MWQIHSPQYQIRETYSAKSSNRTCSKFNFRGESVDEVSFIISGSLEVIQDDEVSVATM